MTPLYRKLQTTEIPISQILAEIRTGGGEEEIIRQIEDDNFTVLFFVIETGNLEALSAIFELIPPERKRNLIAANHFHLVKKLIDHGEGGMIDVVFQAVEELGLRDGMIPAIMKDQSKIIESYFLTRSRPLINFAKIAERYPAIKPALSGIIRDNNFKAICDAVSYGHVEALDAALIILSPEEQSALLQKIAENNFIIFSSAARSDNGQRAVARLAELYPQAESRLAMIRSMSRNEAMEFIVMNGRIGVLEQLLGICPAAQKPELLSLVTKETYYPFRTAIKNGHTEMVKRIVEEYPQPGRAHLIESASFFECEDMIAAHKSGHNEVLAYLLTIFSPAQRSEVVQKIPHLNPEAAADPALGVTDPSAEPAQKRFRGDPEQSA